MKQLTEQEALDFFSEFYYGQHHIPGYKPKEHGYGWSVNHDCGDLSTFDYSGLTRLVLMAHDKCIRVSVNPIRNGIMRIAIWKRERDGDISHSHPTIEQAIEKFRK